MTETIPVCELPKDEHRHIIGAETDPYGKLAYCVGNDVDFHCFDYDFVRDDKGNVWAVLHATVNSETGHFIEDGEYSVLFFNPLDPSNVIRAAARMVESARDWCDDVSCDCPAVRYNRKHSDYFVREVALACIWEGNMAGYEDQVNKFSINQIRNGGKRINKLVNSLADANLLSNV